MALDKQLEISIRDVVEEFGQPNGIAEKLIAWLTNSINGEENPLDEGTYSRYLDLIYEEMILGEED